MLKGITLLAPGIPLQSAIQPLFARIACLTLDKHRNCVAST